MTGGAFMRNTRKLALVCLLIGIIFLVGSMLLLYGKSNMLQFVLDAPAEKDLQQSVSQELIQQLNTLSSVVEEYTFCTRAQGQNIASPFSNISATIYGIHENYFDFRFEALLSGRSINKNDIVNNNPVIMLDQQSALALYSGVDILGKYVTIGSEAYRVIGVFNGGWQVGEADSCIAFIPFPTGIQNGINTNTIECLMHCSGNVSIASTVVKNTLSAWKPSGCFYSMQREKITASMPLRIVLLIASAEMIGFLFRILKRFVQTRIYRGKEQLQQRYFSQCWRRFAAQLMIALLGYSLALAATWGLLQFAMMPLYVFTEWIPEHLFELSSWWERISGLQAEAAAALHIKSREISCAHIGSLFNQWGAFALMVGICLVRNKKDSFMTSDDWTLEGR